MLMDVTSVAMLSQTEGACSTIGGQATRT